MADDWDSMQPLGATPAAQPPAQDDWDSMVSAGSEGDSAEAPVPQGKVTILPPGVPSAAWVGRPLRAPIETSQSGQDYLKLKNANLAGNAGILEGLTPDTSDIPFIGDVIQGNDYVGVVQTAKKLKNNEDVTDDELIKYNTFLEQMNRERDRSWLGDLAYGARKLVSFGAEFAAWTAAVAATGGGAAIAAPGAIAKDAAVELAKLEARKGISQLTKFIATQDIKHQAVRDTIKEASRGVLEGALGNVWGKKVLVDVGGGLAESHISGAGIMLADRALSKMTSLALGQEDMTTEAGTARALELLAKGKDPDMAFWDTLGSDFYNYQSEFLGPYIGKTGAAFKGVVGKRTPQAWKDFGASIAERIQEYWGHVPDLVPKQIAKAGVGAYIGNLARKTGLDGESIAYLAQSMGHNGLIEEMMEERFGGFMTGLFGAQGDEWGIRNAFDQMIPPLNDLGKEAALFALPTLLGVGAHAVVNSPLLGGEGPRLLQEMKIVNRALYAPRLNVKDAIPLRDPAVIRAEIEAENKANGVVMAPAELDAAVEDKRVEEATVRRERTLESAAEVEPYVKSVEDVIMARAKMDEIPETAGNRFANIIRKVLSPLQGLAGMDPYTMQFGRGALALDRALAGNNLEINVPLTQATIATMKAVREANQAAVASGQMTPEQLESLVDAEGRRVIRQSVLESRKTVVLETPEQVAKAHEAGLLVPQLVTRGGEPTMVLMINPEAKVDDAIMRQTMMQLADGKLEYPALSQEQTLNMARSSAISPEAADALIDVDPEKLSGEQLSQLYSLLGVHKANKKHRELVTAWVNSMQNIRKAAYGGSFANFAKQSGISLHITPGRLRWIMTKELLGTDLGYSWTEEKIKARAKEQHAKFGYSFLEKGDKAIAAASNLNVTHPDGKKELFLSLRREAGVLEAPQGQAEDLVEASVPVKDFELASASVPNMMLAGLLKVDVNTDGKSALDRQAERRIEALKGFGLDDAELANKIYEINGDKLQVARLIRSGSAEERKELFSKILNHQVLQWAPWETEGPTKLHRHLTWSNLSAAVGNVAEIDSAAWAPVQDYLEEHFRNTYTMGTGRLDMLAAPLASYWKSVTQAQQQAASSVKLNLGQTKNKPAAGNTPAAQGNQVPAASNPPPPANKPGALSPEEAKRKMDEVEKRRKEEKQRLEEKLKAEQAAREQEKNKVKEPAVTPAVDQSKLQAINDEIDQAKAERTMLDNAMLEAYNEGNDAGGDDAQKQLDAVDARLKELNAAKEALMKGTPAPAVEPAEEPSPAASRTEVELLAAVPPETSVPVIKGGRPVMVSAREALATNKEKLNMLDAFVKCMQGK